VRPGLIALATAAVLAALALAGPTAARPACTPGTQSSGGVNYRTFCGPAKATLHIGGKTYTFTGGSCDNTSSAFTINIGTITLPPGKPKYRYFGITVFTGHDGTFQNQAVSWQFPNGAHNSLFHAKIVLQGGRKKGTFSGKTLADQKPGSGTFSCT
jgi:hypothetical protein